MKLEGRWVRNERVEGGGICLMYITCFHVLIYNSVSYTVKIYNRNEKKQSLGFPSATLPAMPSSSDFLIFVGKMHEANSDFISFFLSLVIWPWTNYLNY